EKALKNPRQINKNLFNAQQARRILDRIVGYELSPFLWKKVARRLSAGRVQSVAVRFVAQREKEIESFKPEEYWTTVAFFKKLKETKTNSLFAEFEALLSKKNGKILSKFEIKSKEDAKEIVRGLKGAKYQIKEIKAKEIKKNSLPPFITSTIQQEAWKKFHFPVKFTMKIAQKLYEIGKITYHRTDSLNLSEESLVSAKKFIDTKYGKNYFSLKKYKTKTKGAQEAHEAIRPTNPNETPEILKNKLDDTQFKLYDLIWKRFIASQMAQAIFDSTTIEIETVNDSQQTKDKYTFKSSGQILKFDGFLKVYPVKYKETQLPFLEKEEFLELTKLIPSQHFTQPPPRYNEATLIKVLEDNEIGRPSTYASIVSTIQDRNYIEKNEQRKFQPTEIGVVVDDLLVKHFPKIINTKWTAEMEKDLDMVARNEKEWTLILKEFYFPFEKNLLEKYKEVSKKNISEFPTKKICPKCGAPLLIRLGRFGKFYACSNFPKCKYTESFEKNGLDIKCPKCENGKIVEKRTKKGKIFYGCSCWPKCDFALWDKPIQDSHGNPEKCPKCDSLLVEKNKKIVCSNRDCDYSKEIKNDIK
ncbi:MAG: type I DNA topoisomerase, partial [Patescibacteria group bacterium]|nr:type I DNA topoisomerase [Patescibacteria group bacterium]